MHNDDDTKMSDRTEYTCCCFGTHTGKPGDGSHVDDGTHAPSKEASDNLTDEHTTGHGKITEAIAEEGIALACDHGCGALSGKAADALSKTNIGVKHDSKVPKKLAGPNGAGTKVANVPSSHPSTISHWDGERKWAEHNKVATMEEVLTRLMEEVNGMSIHPTLDKETPKDH